MTAKLFSTRRWPGIVLAALAALLARGAMAQVGAIAPTNLIDPSSADAAKQVASTKDGQASFTVGKEGVAVTIKPGTASFPGVEISPAGGKAWDLSAYGRVEAKITNTGSEAVRVTVRIDNAGDWKNNPWNAEAVGIKPGKSAVVKVYFGHSFGGQPGFKLNSGAVTKVLIFAGKTEKESSFRVDELLATGTAGEKPPVDPMSLKVKPAGGVVFGPGVAIDPAAQMIAKGGATMAVDEATKGLKVGFAGKAKESAALRYKTAAWSLADYHQVRIKVRNVGAAGARPKARLENRGAATDESAAAAAIEPGQEGEIVVSFVPAAPWQSSEKDGKFVRVPGTGTDFRSNFVTEVVLLPEENGAAQSYLVTSIVGEAPAAKLPEWLGQRPPVEGEWAKTFDEDFAGDTLDLKKWNVYTANFWDKRCRFSKDNVILKDGKAILRFEKKTGFHNDDPNDTATGQKDYTTGFLDTYGKWVQKYGYFEARVKSPRAPGLWPAFWTMPDRGAAAGEKWKRQSTNDGGMEMDIFEHLSGWGPHRYNIAMHFDGYAKNHKATGSSMIYAPADAEGYVTVGLLWTPGAMVYFANGKEVGRWENPRVCSVESHVMLTAVSGGWDNEALDDAQLPADLLIDYVRCWQRKDLASPVDGPKPNNGTLKD